MKLLAIVLTTLVSFSAFSVDIDFGKYTDTNVERMALDAVFEKCPVLFSDGKLIKFVSYEKSIEGDEEVVVMRVFGWRTNGLTGLIKMTLVNSDIYHSDKFIVADFSPMPTSVCR